MECTMSSDAESWSCSIQIRNEFDSMGHPSPVKTKNFVVINDKSQIELALRRAQAAVLSPHKELTYFLGMSATQLKECVTHDPESLKFSKNVIEINVKDPEATDLSFVDLPGPFLFFCAYRSYPDWHVGLIHNAETNLITTVRQLVEHYIEGKKNTLVVIAMPMTGEFLHHLPYDGSLTTHLYRRLRENGSCTSRQRTRC